MMSDKFGTHGITRYSLAEWTKILMKHAPAFGDYEIKFPDGHLWPLRVCSTEDYEALPKNESGEAVEPGFYPWVINDKNARHKGEH